MFSSPEDPSPNGWSLSLSSPPVVLLRCVRLFCLRLAADDVMDAGTERGVFHVVVKEVRLFTALDDDLTNPPLSLLE